MKKFPLVAVVLLSLSVTGLWLYLPSRPKPDEKIIEAFKEMAVVHRRDAGAPRESAIQGHASVDRILFDMESPGKKILTAEQRIQRARDLNAAYFESASEYLHQRISDALTHALHEEDDPEVARAIAFSHSRLPYDENFWPNLRTAYGRKVLSFDDYYGELAHGYDQAPQQVRKQMVKEISLGHSRYALDIIASQLSATENIAYSQPEIADLKQFFGSNEPIFGGSEDAFGYFDAITYVNWLLAYAHLQKAAGGIGMEQYLGDKLLDPDTDPRAAVAFFATGHAATLNPSQRSEMQWAAVQGRARALVARYPEAPVWQQVGKELAN